MINEVALPVESNPRCCLKYSVVIFMNLVGPQQVSIAIETYFVGLYYSRDPSLRLSKSFITITIFMLFSKYCKYLSL